PIVPLSSEENDITIGRIWHRRNFVNCSSKFCWHLLQTPFPGSIISYITELKYMKVHIGASGI
ncbi:MAG: hypothetical protein WAM42_22485, partial [Candidatus Nitrosopolaris sp.]